MSVIYFRNDLLNSLVAINELAYYVSTTTSDYFPHTNKKRYLPQIDIMESLIYENSKNTHCVKIKPLLLWHTIFLWEAEEITTLVSESSG